MLLLYALLALALPPVSATTYDIVAPADDGPFTGLPGTPVVGDTLSFALHGHTVVGTTQAVYNSCAGISASMAAVGLPLASMGKASYQFTLPRTGTFFIVSTDDSGALCRAGQKFLFSVTSASPPPPPPSAALPDVSAQPTSTASEPSLTVPTAFASPTILDVRVAISDRLQIQAILHSAPDCVQTCADGGKPANLLGLLGTICTNTTQIFSIQECIAADAACSSNAQSDATIKSLLSECVTALANASPANSTSNSEGNGSGVTVTSLVATNKTRATSGSKSLYGRFASGSALCFLLCLLL